MSSGLGSFTAHEWMDESQVSLSGALMLEFGAPWCEYCQVADVAIAEVLAENPQLRHFKIYDGKGKPLGRQLKVKLWPTLILLQNGDEIARLVRPVSAAQVRQFISPLKDDKISR